MPITSKNLIPCLSLALMGLGAPLAHAKKSKAKDADVGAPNAATDGKTVGAETEGPAKKKAAFGKFGFGAMLGGGFDSNVYNKKDGPSAGGVGEVSAQAKLDVPAAPWVSWSSQLGLSGSYRAGENSA